jgi:hypothetical protein
VTIRLSSQEKAALKREQKRLASLKVSLAELAALAVLRHNIAKARSGVGAGPKVAQVASRAALASQGGIPPKIP